MKVLIVLLNIFLIINIANGQKRINFTKKKISELGVDMGVVYSVEEYRPSFPLIWDNFYPNSDEYIFSGYYTLDAKSDADNKILTGEVKLSMIQFQVAEGTLNLKEELIFNFKDGDMKGPVSYFQFSSDNNGETSEADSKNIKWKKEISISATFSHENNNYNNIQYFETSDWEKTQYIISQGSGYTISLSYFRTIININNASPNEKPVFKKIKY